MNVVFYDSRWQVALGIWMAEIAMCLALILLVLGLFRNVIGPTGCRLLWCVLILRCLVPVSIPTQYHPIAFLIPTGNVQEIAARSESDGLENETIKQPLTQETAAGNVSDRLENVMIEKPAISQETVTQNDAMTENSVLEPVAYAPGCDLSTIAFCIWLTGFVTFLTVAIVRNRRVIRAACRSPEPVPPWMQTLFLTCRDRLKLRVWPVLIITPHVKTPCLTGAIRPRVLVPASLLNGEDISRRDAKKTKFAKNSLKTLCDLGDSASLREIMNHVFLHELTHLKQGDIWLSWCWTLVMAVHWFNPLLWWVGRLVGFDCEAACDDRVLAQLKPEQRASYGRSLLDMMQKLNAPVVRSPGFSAVIEGSTNFERRLIMITNYRKQTMQQAVAGTVIPVLLLAASLTTFAQQTPEPIPADKAKMIGYVEDFFLHNDRDITMRKSLEWGDVTGDDQGNHTIRYKFEALVRDKDRVIQCEDFTFDKDGKFVSSKKADGFPQDVPPLAPTPATTSKTESETNQGTLEILLNLQNQLYAFKKAKIQLDDELFRFEYSVDPKLEEMQKAYENAQGDEKQRILDERQKYFSRTRDALHMQIGQWDVKIKATELELEHLKAVAQLKRDFGPPTQPKMPPPTRTDNTTKTDNDHIWNKLGIRVTPVSNKEFQERNEGLILPHDYDIEGAVEVQEVKPDGVFASASLKIQKGDMLVGIITPAKDCWSITRVNDLKFVADQWTPERMGGNKVKFLVVRDKKLLEGKLPVSKP